MCVNTNGGYSCAGQYIHIRRQSKTIDVHCNMQMLSFFFHKINTVNRQLLTITTVLTVGPLLLIALVTTAVVLLCVCCKVSVHEDIS